MKKITVVLLSVFFLASCGKDSNTCKQSDYVGFFSIEGEGCLLTGTDVELTVFANGPNGVNFDWANATSRLTLAGPLIINECMASVNVVNVQADTDMQVNAMLDGKKMTITYNGKFSGKVINCTETYKK